MKLCFQRNNAIRRTLGLPSQSFTECHVAMHPFPSPARLLSPHRKRKGLPGGLLIAKAEKNLNSQFFFDQALRTVNFDSSAYKLSRRVRVLRFSDFEDCFGYAKTKKFLHKKTVWGKSSTTGHEMVFCC